MKKFLILIIMLLLVLSVNSVKIADIPNEVTLTQTPDFNIMTNSVVSVSNNETSSFIAVPQKPQQLDFNSSWELHYFSGGKWKKSKKSSCNQKKINLGKKKQKMKKNCISVDATVFDNEQTLESSKPLKEKITFTAKKTGNYKIVKKFSGFDSVICNDTQKLCIIEKQGRGYYFDFGDITGYPSFTQTAKQDFNLTIPIGLVLSSQTVIIDPTIATVQAPAKVSNKGLVRFDTGTDSNLMTVFNGDGSFPTNLYSSSNNGSTWTNDFNFTNGSVGNPAVNPYIVTDGNLIVVSRDTGLQDILIDWCFRLTQDCSQSGNWKNVVFSGATSKIIIGEETTSIPLDINAKTKHNGATWILTINSSNDIQPKSCNMYQTSTCDVNSNWRNEAIIDTNSVPSFANFYIDNNFILQNRGFASWINAEDVFFAKYDAQKSTTTWDIQKIYTSPVFSVRSDFLLSESDTNAMFAIDEITGGFTPATQWVSLNIDENVLNPSVTGSTDDDFLKNLCRDVNNNFYKGFIDAGGAKIGVLTRIRYDVNNTVSGEQIVSSTGSAGDYVASWNQKDFNNLNYLDYISVEVGETTINYGQHNKEPGVQSINQPPTVTVTIPNGGQQYEKRTTGQTTISWTFTDADNQSVITDINYSTTSTQGTGVVILDDVNSGTGGIDCVLSPFAGVQNCSFTWNINPVPTGKYYILISVSDQLNSNFDASDSDFNVASQNDFNVSYPQNGETFNVGDKVDVNFWVLDPDPLDTPLIDLRNGVSQGRQIGTIITDGNALNSNTLIRIDSNFSSPLDFATSSATSINIPNGDLNFTLRKDGNVMGFLRTSTVKTAGGGSGDSNVSVLINGVIKGLNVRALSGNNAFGSVGFPFYATGLSSGTHGVRTQLSSVSGTDTVETRGLVLTVIPLENLEGQPIPNTGVINLTDSTASGSYVDIVGSEKSIWLERNSKIDIEAGLDASISSNNQDLNFRIVVDGVQCGVATKRFFKASNSRGSVTSTCTTNNLTRGNHQVKLQWFTTGGTLTGHRIDYTAMGLEAGIGFEADTNTITNGSFSTTSASLVDVTTMTRDVNLMKSGRIRALFDVTGQIGTNNRDFNIAININGVDSNENTRTNGLTTDTASAGVLAVSPILSPGIYTVKARARVEGGATLTLSGMSLKVSTDDTNGSFFRCDDTNLMTVQRCSYRWDTTGYSPGNFYINGEVSDNLPDLNFDTGNDFFTLVGPPSPPSPEVSRPPQITTRFFSEGDNRKDTNRYFKINDPRKDINHYYSFEDSRFNDENIVNTEMIDTQAENSLNFQIVIFILILVLIIIGLLLRSGTK